jgi:predicted O-methyltransferase YrrM
MKLNNFIPLPIDLRGWNGNNPIFAQLISQVKPNIILEVGTWKGQSTISMAKAVKALHYQATIFCIDTWLGAIEFKENERLYGDDWNRMLLHGYPQVYYQFISNCVHEDVIDLIEPVPATSRDAVKFVPDAELIYIDGDHTYLGVLEDLNNYWPKLKPGGVMFGDDYTLKLSKPRANDQYNPEVYKAIDEFVANNNLELEIIDNNFWLIRKNMV